MKSVFKYGTIINISILIYFHFKSKCKLDNLHFRISNKTYKKLAAGGRYSDWIMYFIVWAHTNAALTGVSGSANRSNG